MNVSHEMGQEEQCFCKISWKLNCRLIMRLRFSFWIYIYIVLINLTWLTSKLFIAEKLSRVIVDCSSQASSLGSISILAVSYQVQININVLQINVLKLIILSLLWFYINICYTDIYIWNTILLEILTGVFVGAKTIGSVDKMQVGWPRIAHPDSIGPRAKYS